MALSLTRRYPWLDGNVILVVLIIKVVLMIFAAVAFQIIKEQPLAGDASFRGIWMRWDAVDYLQIAERG